MKLRQHGFTMIELIVVLVLIAILATIAVPRFLNLNSSSKQNATDAIAASLTTVSASNYAQRSANSATGSAITNCTDVGPLLSGGLPAGYSITSLAAAAGASVNCTLNGPGSTTATFVAIGIA
ncbi:MAG: type II secretion system protein [Gammaproteobacteria bacterium]|nr:type II secretion system protein [Gammaproteobacteria bacterium]